MEQLVFMENQTILYFVSLSVIWGYQLKYKQLVNIISWFHAIWQYDSVEITEVPLE